MSGTMPFEGETNIRRIVLSVRELFQGRGNAMGELTLAANVTETVVQAANCGQDSRISLTPRTANAAAALGTTYIPAADVGPGVFTVRHANSAQIDRTFGYSIRG